MHDDDAEVSRFLVEHAFAALTRLPLRDRPWYGPKRVD